MQRGKTKYVCALDAVEQRTALHPGVRRHSQYSPVFPGSAFTTVAVFAVFAVINAWSGFTINGISRTNTVFTARSAIPRNAAGLCQWR